MSTATLLPSPATASPVSAEAVEPTGGAGGTAAFDRVRAALAVYVAKPADGEGWAELLDAMRAASAVIAAFRRQQINAPDVAAARALIVEVSRSGVHDAAVTERDLAAARGFGGQNWPGLLAAMLLTPAWQWREAPPLTAAPDWLWGDYAAWLFATPQRFSAPGQTAAYAGHYLRRAEELVGWLKRNRGAASVRAALAAYAQHASDIPLYFYEGSLRRHAELRAQLYAAVCRRQQDNFEAIARPRAGRRLRIGFINRHFGPQTETFTTLPSFELLDPERFEVVLFTHGKKETPVQSYCRERCSVYRVLPADLGQQLAMLRAAALDVAVFGTNLTGVMNQVGLIALHRVAPLQVVNNSSCITSGFPEIDLYVSGTLTETAESPAQFSERLGLLPGPAHAFNYEAGREAPTGSWTRAMLGLPDDAAVFVSAANYFKIIPEMQHEWARLLAAVPGSYLLVHPFNPNWSSTFPLERFCAEFDAVLAEHGVDRQRLVVSTVRFPSRSDVKELLRVGDVYLDTFPFGGVNSLIDPLEIGIPVVAWEGDSFRSRMGAALLRVIGLDELVARDAESYRALGRRLATSGEERQALRTRIEDRMSRTPIFLDTLAASDAFGALMETAFDELEREGREAFRRNREPLRASTAADASALLVDGEANLKAGRFAEADERAWRLLAADPASPPARQLMGRVRLAQGRAARAVSYFLAAVQHVDGNAPLWHDLAVAFGECQQIPQALQALEACLRINARYLDGWLMLARLARDAGNGELWQDALNAARELAPDDERIAALAVAVPADRQGETANAAATRHILVYTDDPQHGGVAHYNHALLLALARAGHRVSCVQSTSASPLVQEQREAGVRHLWLDYATDREFGRTVQDKSHAEWIFRVERPDLIVFSDCSPVSNLAARDVALALGIPYVAVVGFVGEYLAKNFAGQLARLAGQYAQATDVVAVSQENLDLLRTRFGLAADRGRVIHYGRPARFFSPRDETVRARLRAEAKIPADAVVCFTAARLATVKGFDSQLKAAKRLHGSAAGERVHFVWAGDGDQRAALEREIAQQGLGGVVHLLGQRWDVADWYDAADIFVLPSRMEGMPLAIMEAMAKGLAVVTTAVSGIPEELGDTGRLLPDPATDAVGVVTGLVETVAAWAANPAECRAQGERCRERAMRMFREELMIERTLDVIDHALEAPRVPVPAPEPSAKDDAAAARSAFERGDYREALRLAQAALKADHRSIAALAVLGDVALLKDATMAENIFRQALQIAPHDATLSAGLGEALLGQNKSREAGKVLRAAAAGDPRNLRVLTATARWHEREGRFDEAAVALRLAVPLAPATAAACLGLGHAFKRCGCLPEALGRYRRAVGVETPIAAVDPAAKPVRIALLVQYPQGWTSIRSVWEAFRDDPQFATTIIACPNRPPNQVEGGSNAIYGFLEQQGVLFTRWTDFRFEPGFADVLFIQLPYDITRPTPLHGSELLKLVPRLAYVPYALEIGGGAENINLLTNLPLHQFAWAVFARSARHKAAFARSCASGDAHVVVTGHPKMDALRGLAAARDAELERFIAGRKMVIWNPHYDARPDGSEWGTGYSTFLRWWRFLPGEFGRRQDLAFVIRPHPLFFDTLKQRQLMTAEQVDEFLARCSAAGNVQIDRRSSYLPVFAASAAMMSDASSFVLEYAATGHPLLYLHNPHGPGLNADGAFVRDHCATAQTEAEIAAFLDDLAAGRDEHGDERRAAYRSEFMHLPAEGAGEAIKQAVLARLRTEASELNAASR